MVLVDRQAGQCMGWCNDGAWVVHGCMGGGDVLGGGGGCK